MKKIKIDKEELKKAILSGKGTIELQKLFNCGKTTLYKYKKEYGLSNIKIKTGNLKSHNTYIGQIKDKNINAIDTYTTARTKIKHKCIICNNIWAVTPDHILAGSGCPKCNKKLNKGLYSNYSRKYCDNLGYKLYFYIVKLQLDGEIFYKYGLTKHKDKRRFTKYKPYKVLDIIRFKEYNAWDAVCLEKITFSNYTPKYKFCGWTECYKI